MLYDWSMDSNHSTEISGSKTDVVCARVGGANTTPLLGSAKYEFRQQRRKGSESRPHSSPDPSCGREKSRGRANPFPQTNCFSLPSPFFRVLHQDCFGKKF